MKNFVIINLNNGGSCEYIEKIADEDNIVILQILFDNFNSPTFSLVDGSDSLNMAAVVEVNYKRDIEIPMDWIRQHKNFKLEVIDSVPNIKYEFSFITEAINIKSNILVRPGGSTDFIIYSAVNNNYSDLPIATRSKLGAVIVGKGLDVTTSGILSGEEIEILTNLQIENLLK